ncbi:MAG: hypothetical protein U0T32_01560 [Chitinophagales bacterium]
MGTFKKQISAAITLTLVLGLVFMSACKKEAGPAGKDGNTNVKVYLFAGANLTSGLFYITNNIPIRFSAVDSSVVLAYHKCGGYWFATPGLGYGPSYMARVRYYNTGYPDSTEVTTSIFDMDGSLYSGGSVTIEKVKYVVAPASAVYGKKETVDYSDYKATMKYFGLSED